MAKNKDKWFENYEAVKAHVVKTGHFPDKHQIGNLKPHYIDMLNSQEHVREFLKSLTEGAADDVIDKPLDGELLWQKNYFANVFTAPEEIDFL